MADMKQGSHPSTQKNQKQPLDNMRGKHRGQDNPAIKSEKERGKDYAKAGGSKR